MSNVIKPFPKPNPFIVFEIIKGLGKLVRAIKGYFSSNDKVKSQQSLNKEKSSADDIAQIHQMLSDYRSEAKNVGFEIIKSIKDDCNSFFEKTLSQFERYSESFGMKHMTGTYQKRFSTTLDGLDEIFDSCLSKKFSLDDSECVSILKMQPGEAKANRMSEFKKSVFTQAIDDVCKCIEKSIEDFFDSINDTFMIKINSMASAIEEKSNAFEKMTIDREKTDLGIETTRLNASETVSIADIAFEILERGAE